MGPELGENNMPGFDPKLTLTKRLVPDWVYKSVSLLSPDYQTTEEMAFDIHWYQRASYGNVTNTVHQHLADQFLDDMSPSRLLSSSWGGEASKYLEHQVVGFKNIELATRTFDASERGDIIGRIRAYGKRAGWSQKLINGMTLGMGAAPTHHQKTVLIDYEYPELAVGYVMGHNMLDQYWDTDEHKALPATPKTGRSGPTPWQDISSRVTGPILQDINANFCQAWDAATGQKLTEARKKSGVAGKHNLCLGGSSNERGVMAQILRTQSQYGKTDIRKLYLQALNNATQYVFVQNQYFRWDEFADTIKQVARTHQKGGRDAGTHGPIYLFVITNSSDAAVGEGTYSTYQMLDSLGYSDRMPGVKYAEAEDKFAAQKARIEGQLGKLQQEEKRMSTQSYDWSQIAGAANYIAELRGREGVVSGEIGDIDAQRSAFEQEQKQKQADRQSTDASKLTSGVDLRVASPGDTPTLKVLICTLVAPDTPAKAAWVPVYVHAKLGIIDDAFTTLGSANINFRSMNVDSEINVAIENGQIATELRRQLWGLHTTGRELDGKPKKDRFIEDATGQSDLDSAYTAWCAIVTENKQLRNEKKAPRASLVEFLRESKDRSYKD